MADVTTGLALPTVSNTVQCNLLIQRGMLHRLADDDEKARKDMEEAARLGSPFAKKAAVQLNPYAALCNQMLSQAMREFTAPPAP